MRNYLKRLLCLNLALILLLCAAIPASAGRNDAQPQLNAQPTAETVQTGNDSQTQTADSNPGTHKLTINGTTYVIGEEEMSRGGWTASARFNGDGHPVLALTLSYYNGDAISITANDDYSGTARPIIMLRFRGHCNIRGRQDSAALTISGYDALIVEMAADTEAGSSELSIGGHPAVSIPDGWIRLDSTEITLTGWGNDPDNPAYEAQSFTCSLSSCRTEENSNGVIYRITTTLPRTVTVKGSGGTNWDGTTDDLILTCEDGGDLDLANAFMLSRKYVAYYQGDDGNEYSPFLIYPDLKPGNTVLTAVWADCDYEIPAIFYGNRGDDRTVFVLDGSREWTVPELEAYSKTYGEQTYNYTPLCWENQIGGKITQLLSGQKMPALTRPTAYHGGYTVSENGLIFCANGETFENGWVVVQPVNTYVTDEFWSHCESGKKFLSWNTEPDGTGVSYANGVDVPESHEKFVWLYAQWNQDAPKPGIHTLTIDGNSYQVSESIGASGQNWNAGCGLNGDGNPILYLNLHDYHGGPIQISDPIDTNGASTVIAIINFYGSCEISSDTGPAITASGYQYLTFQGREDDAWFRAAGKPAVQTTGVLTLASKDITLDGLAGPAYEAADFRYNASECKPEMGYDANGVLVTVSTVESLCTITVHGEGGTNQNGTTDDVILKAKRGEPVDLSNLFYKTGAYVEYYLYETETERSQCIPWLWAEGDMEVKAVWKDCDYDTPAVFYVNGTDNSAILVDGSQETWIVPDMQPYDITDMNGKTYHNTPLSWRNENDGWITELVPGQQQKKLEHPTGYYGWYTNAENGIIFCANGETFEGNNGMSVIHLTKNHVTRHWDAASGKKLKGWNTEPDGSGKSYAVYGEDVPASYNGLIRLYAQWADADSVTILVQSAGYKNGSAKYYVQRGGKFTMPDPGTLDGQKLAYWSCWYLLEEDGGKTSRYCRAEYQSGETISIPENAVEYELTAYWLPEGKLIIGGSSYTFDADRTYYFSSDNTWTCRYLMEQGRFQLSLWGYQGSEISLPASAGVTVQEGRNTITGSAGKPAIRCTGELGLDTVCIDETQHPTLTVTGGAGAAAIEADYFAANRMTHTELIAGSGKAVFAGRTENGGIGFYFTDYCTYYGKAGEEADYSKVDPTNLPTTLSALRAEPNQLTLTVNGGGAASDGAASRAWKVEGGQLVSISALNFRYPGYYFAGYVDDVGRYSNSTEVSVGRNRTITLDWVNSGFTLYQAFMAYGELQNESEIKNLYTNKFGNRVLFVDYSTGSLTAPTVVYQDAASWGDLLYWHCAGADGEQQYVPGETINDLPADSTLYAETMGGYALAFFANGKQFADGRKVIVSWSNYCESFAASDGTKLLSWNTKPDGTGDSYAPDTSAPHGTKLYAQWMEEGKVAVSLHNYALNDAQVQRLTAEPGEDLVLKQPETIPTGLTFTHWRCYYIKDDTYTELENVPAGGKLHIPEDAAEVTAVANWQLAAPMRVDGKEYRFGDTYAYYENGWAADFYTEGGWIYLTLNGYDGGGMELPANTTISVVGDPSTIHGTLDCAATLQINEKCEYGSFHGTLTVKAEGDNPAIRAAELQSYRTPHLTLIGGETGQAIANVNGKWSIYWDGRATYYGKTAHGAAEMQIQPVKDNAKAMQELRTEPLMCQLTLDGSGGMTADGKTTAEVQLEYGQLYDLRKAGFKKQYADLMGVSDRGNTFSRWTDLKIMPYAAKLTLHLNWRNLGYPYIAFRANGELQGEGIENQNTTVIYERNGGELTVPKVVYQNPASFGDLVYWFTSEDGDETQTSHQYLAGERVNEPDDTTLYAASIRWNEAAFVATGTTFKDGRRIVTAASCEDLQSSSGKRIESWNTEPDGSGVSYPVGKVISEIENAPRILYAQWKTSFEAKVDEKDPATGEQTVTITPKQEEDVKPPEDTTADASKEASFEDEKLVVLAAYKNGKFVGMYFAYARGGKIYCKLPAEMTGAEYELKMFFMAGGKPSREMEIIRITE